MKKLTRMVRLLGFHLICVLISFFTFAQSKTYQFEHLSIEDGLSQNFISSIEQDHKGFMWFGTKDGLNRYDGNEFRVYHHVLSDSTSLQSNTINILFEDSQHRFWVGAGGVSRYDRLYDRFERVLSLKEIPGSSTESEILDIAEDRHGDLWIAIAKAGLYRLRIRDSINSFKKGKDFDRNSKRKYSLYGPYHFTDKPDMEKEYPEIKKLLVIGDDLWVSHANGISILETLQNKSIMAPEKISFRDPLTHLFPENTIYGTMFMDNKGSLWLGTAKGLVQIKDPKLLADIHFFDYPKKWFGQKWMGLPKNIITDNTGLLWISTYYGIVLFDSYTGSFQHLLNDINDPTSLNYNGVTSLFMDAGQIVWVGTGGKGLSKHILQAKRFQHYLGQEKTKMVHSIYAILEDSKGDLWMSVNGGLKQFGRAKDSMELKAKGTIIESLSLTNFVKDKQGVIWAVDGQALVRMDSNTHQTDLFPYLTKEKSVSFQESVHAVVNIDQENRIWVCNNNALYCFIPAIEAFEKYNLPGEELGKVNAFLRDKIGRFWIATEKGLFKIDLKTGEWNHFQSKVNQPNGLNDNKLNCLILDPTNPEKYLWVGTGGGLHRLDMEEGHFDVYTMDDGLPNNYIYGILSDDSGRLWMSTNRGLACLDLATMKFKNYKVEDGLQSNEFNTRSYYKSESGELFFGGINGLTTFFPEQIKDNNYIPPVEITDFLLSYESTKFEEEGSPLKYSISETKEISLKHDQNTIAFEFAALDFTRPKSNQFKYILEGFDKDWIEANTEHKATYTNLPPGNYTFRVKGSNNDGIFNEEGVEVKVFIAKPFWKTWWAYLIYASFICMLSYSIYRYLQEKNRARIKIQLNEEESKRLREINRLKSRFFANITHEFRTPITLIQGRMEELLAELKRDDLREKVLSAKRNSSQLLRLIEQLLDISRLESNKLKLNNRTGNLITNIFDLINDLRLKAKKQDILLEFNSDTDKLMAEFDSDVLQKVIHNLTENAIKFSPPGGIVKVNLTKNQPQDENKRNHKIEEVSIQVIDEGIGIPEKDLPFIFDRYYQAENNFNSDQGFGLGLSLIKELVKLLSGSIQVESELGKGTKFTFVFPVCCVYEEPLIFSESKTSKIPFLETEALAPPQGLPIDPKMTHYWKKIANKRILIVEDKIDLNNYIKEMLQPEFQILQARDGMKGLETAMKELPDLIISDIMMPGINGFEMVESLMNDLRTSHIPIILLTAKVSREDRLRGLKLGVYDYIIKPFQKDELITKIRNIFIAENHLVKKYQSLFMPGISFEETETNEQLFLQKIKGHIEKNISDEAFGVERLANDIGMSTSTLYRKLLSLTESTPVQLIQHVRLSKASELLNKGYNVSEVSYMVGFRSTSYFSQAFKKKYSCTPRDYSKAN